MSRPATKPARHMYRPQAGLDAFLTQDELEHDCRREAAAEQWTARHMKSWCTRRTSSLLFIAAVR